jgi:hypothetical protein
MSSQDRKQIGVVGDYLSARREHLDKFDTLIDFYPLHRRLWRQYGYWLLHFPGFALRNFWRSTTLWLQYNYAVAAEAIFGGNGTQAFEKKLCANMRQMEAEDPSLRARVFSVAEE